MPSFLSLLCILLIFFSFNTTTLKAAEENKSEIDRQALLCLKSGINSGINSYPLGILNSWSDDSLNFCSWKGVICGTKFPPRVVSLNLTSARLSGQISGCVGNLTFLSLMNLADNYLSGTIPAELGKLPNLHTLNLSNSNLEGNIPDSLGTSNSLSYVNLANNTLTGGFPLSLASSSSLSTLVLSRNSLSGEIPSSLFDNSSNLTMVDLQMNSFTGVIPPFHEAPALRFLWLTGNFLSGSIPPSIGNISSLTSILLGQNRLSGLIPETLSHITKLLELDLSYNSLSGSVPLSLYSMSSLKYFSVGSNGLVGQIPPYIGYSLPNLQSLIMGSNRLEGLIPASLANMLNLQILDLSNNSLHGSVPSLGSLANLRQLVLGRNLLEAHDWSFLTSLASCTQLTKLSLEGNALNGSLPISVVNLSTTLEDLSLASNQISGSIPLEISSLGNLTSLRLESNFLSGSIPSTIGKLQYLYILSLSNNKLSGQIPRSVGDMTQLGKLYLGDNNLSGNIPGSLGQCKGLLELNLSRNNLNGSIPVELFANPPFSLGLDFSHNNLTGELPLELGKHGAGDGPAFLHMEGNKFYGKIPARWQLASTLQINLSHNDLSGVVPELFWYLPKLEQLDLSYNNLEGSIPTSGIFENSSAVVLDGNKGLCSNSLRLAILPICPGISSSGVSSATKRNHHLSLLATLPLIVLPPLTIASLVLLWFLPALWKRAVFLFLQLAVVSKKMFCFVTHHKRREVHTVPRNDEKKLKRVSYQDILKAQPSENFKETMKRVSYGDIRKATSWFSLVNRISLNHTASVYIGRFEFDTDLVAIKVFHLSEQGSRNSFFTECEVLKHTRHRNLVQAITLCSTVDFEGEEFKAIVYEFIANGSLDMWIHPRLHRGSPRRLLSLGQRISIAADVAAALEYLHNQLTPPLIHCDLKPSNVLLDYDMTSRIGDFGSAKFLSSGIGKPEGLVGVGGTIGYIAPEYGMGCKISTGYDMYSFGVLLLEMLTAIRPTDALCGDALSLHKYVDLAFPDRIAEVLDPHMPSEEDEPAFSLHMQKYIIPLVSIGLMCTMDSPKDRPGMHDVCARIVAIKQAFVETL